MSYEKERDEVIDWLKHPNELGKAPFKIEFAKEFTDPEGIHCLIFKFKTGALSPWLLAIHSDSGIFSEEEKYDEKRDIEQAQALINYLKQYWKNVALNAEESKKRAENAKAFCGFVLKAEQKFEPELFLKNYEEDWGEKLSNCDTNPEDAEGGTAACIYSNEQGLNLVFGYMDFRVPNGEAEENAQFNFFWKEAVETTRTHKAHEVVTVMGIGEIRDKAMFFAKALVSLCRMDNNIGVYMNGVVFEPKMVVAMTDIIKENKLPLLVLVWCGIGREESGVSCWSDGMKCFGFDELEMVNVQGRQPSEIHSMMLYIIDYCINQNVSFHDGEEVGLSAGLKAKIVKSKGFNVDMDGETLKISF